MLGIGGVPVALGDVAAYTCQPQFLKLPLSVFFAFLSFASLLLFFSCGDIKDSTHAAQYISYALFSFLQTLTILQDAFFASLASSWPRPSTQTSLFSKLTF